MTNEIMKDSRKLVAFLYVLMREDVVPGRIETILERHVFDVESEYSNVHLARYAQEIAARLSEQQPEGKNARE
jgi:hypothetical protein